MASLTDLEGTCPACFRTVSIRSDAGRMVVGKHGWSESGGRQVGQYGNAYHVGECFGVGRAPFEVSPEGTVAFVSEVLFPVALAAQNETKRLRGEPDLYEVRNKNVLVYGENGGAMVPCPYTVRHRRGEEGYAKRLEGEVAQSVAHGDRACADGAELTARVSAWAPAPLATRAPKVAVVHLRALNTTSGRPACFSRRMHVGRAVVSENLDAVTCTKCRAGR